MNGGIAQCGFLELIIVGIRGLIGKTWMWMRHGLDWWNLSMNEAQAWLAKLEHEWGLGFINEAWTWTKLKFDWQSLNGAQAWALNCNVGIKNQTLMVLNLSRFITPPWNVGEFFKPCLLIIFLCIFLCVHYTLNIEPMSRPRLCFKNRNSNWS
jgi:hypothetical protein